MIQLEKISLVFNRGTALENPVFRDFSLDIESGQFVTVIGSNGAGKSTLLNVIAGEVAIDAGRASQKTEGMACDLRQHPWRYGGIIFRQLALRHLTNRRDDACRMRDREAVEDKGLFVTFSR